MVRGGGTVVEFGFAPESRRGKVEIDPRLLVTKGVVLLRCLGVEIGDFGSVLRIMETYGARARFRKMKTHRFSLDKVKGGLELASKGGCMKAAIEPVSQEVSIAVFCGI